MIVFLNGRFVPEEEARVSVFDRGFLYGDSLFEVVRVAKGRLFRWQDHWQRLDGGAQFLGIARPYSSKEALQFANALIHQNNASEAVLRIQLSRGVGARGYSPRSAKSPTLVMSVHPLADSDAVKWKVVTTGFRTNPSDPLAGFKTGNKLPQVLAKAEAEERGAQEGLLLSPDGLVAEGTSANIFWVERDTVCTPPLSLGILPGITRAVVLEICKRLGIVTRECSCKPESLKGVTGLFCTLASRGIVEVEMFEDARIERSPVVSRLIQTYQELLKAG